MTRIAALVVVDMLNDFLARGGYYDEIAKLQGAKSGAWTEADIAALARVHLQPPPQCVIRDGYLDLVANVCQVASAALARQMPTIFVRTAYDPASQHKPPLFIGNPGRRDYACHPGTWGSEIVDPIKGLTSHPCATVVVKPTYDAFYETELGSVLRSRDVDTLYIVGVETNVCVLFTALTALTHGFSTVIIDDCVATSLPALQAPALRIFEVAKGRRVERHSFLATL